MPSISFVSSKGGVGKTTTALTVAGALVDGGATVALIDADPNQPLTAWAKRGRIPDGIDVTTNVHSTSIGDEIAKAQQRARYVLVDLEGSANSIVTFAISNSDFTVIPVKGSHLDATEAIKALRLIRATEQATGRTIPHAVLFTQTSAAIQGNTLRHVRSEFSANAIDTFATELFEREAYRIQFSLGGTVFTLQPDEVSGIGKAQDNAIAVTNELLAKLKSVRKRGKAA